MQNTFRPNKAHFEACGQPSVTLAKLLVYHRAPPILPAHQVHGARRGWCPCGSEVPATCSGVFPGLMREKTFIQIAIKKSC